MLANGILFLVFDQVREIFTQQAGYSFLGSEIDLSFLAAINTWFFFTMGITQMFSFIGAYKMFKLEKKGFHLYTIAQILLLIIPKLFIPSLPFPIFEMMISAIFVLLYYKNLQFMS